MKPIKIVTDSTVQLSKEEQDKYNITIVPLTAMVENVVYYDNLTVTKPEFLQKMLNSPELPKTSQPAVGKFTELFNELGADGSEVLSIHVAGYLSGRYMSAVQGASLSTAKVTVIESGFLDRAMAFQVLAAAEMAKTGAAMSEIVSTLEEVKSKTTLYVGIVHLENLIKGGRMSQTLGRISNFLNMKLILSLTPEEITLYTKSRGMKSLRGKVDAIIEKMKSYPEIKQIGISHVGMSSFTEATIKELKEQFPDAVFYVAYASPTLMTHAGNEAFAISYLTD
ncbi:MAG: DegV family protein [Carnobacterium sp.]|uniref:DegV family protein n=1 Tax=Carnobacterium sp. TaxID=48221 RepID=UPI002FC73AA6